MHCDLFCNDINYYGRQVPILTLPSGKIVVESGAISRYAAKRAGLYPEDAEKQLLVDEILELVSSLMSKAPQDKDPELKKKNREEFAAGFLTTGFNHIASRLVEGPLFLGTELSVADIQFYSVVKMLRSGHFDHVSTDFDAKWPVIEKFVGALEADTRFAPHKL